MCVLRFLPQHRFPQRALIPQPLLRWHCLFSTPSRAAACIPCVLVPPWLLGPGFRLLTQTGAALLEACQKEPLWILAPFSQGAARWLTPASPLLWPLLAVPRSQSTGPPSGLWPRLSSCPVQEGFPWSTEALLCLGQEFWVSTWCRWQGLEKVLPPKSAVGLSSPEIFPPCPGHVCLLPPCIRGGDVCGACAW